MRILGYALMFAALGGALVSCSDDEDIDTPGPGEATGGAADAGAPSTSSGSDTGGRPATGGAVNAGGQAGAETTTGGSDGGADSATGGASAGAAGDTSAPGGSGGSGAGDEFPSSCGKLLGFSECDPVSGFPCDLEAGETCDFEVMLGAYACFEGPNDATFCGSCDPDLGEFCGAGTTCNFDYLRCERYCCDDSDCASGTCLRNPFQLEQDDEAALVGVCAEEAEALCTAGEGEGGAGAGGAGSGGASEEVAGSGGAG